MGIQGIQLLSPNQNVDSTSLTDNLEVINDGYRDEFGAIHRRPGYELLCDLAYNYAIDGMYWWSIAQAVIIVANGKVFKVSTKTGTFSEIPGVTLLAGIRVIFAELYYTSTPLVFMANGGKIAYTDGASVAYVADEHAPTQVSHIVEFNTFLIANSVGTPTFYFSNPNDPLTWDATDNYDAEVSTDNIECIYVAGGRLYLLGKRSIETWYNSGTAGDPFIRRLSSTYVEDGIYSPYTISLLDGKLVFLNKKRKMVKIEVDESTVISQAYDKVFQGIEYANDAYSENISIDGRDFFITTFKSANKTIVYDYTLNSWYEWSYLNDSIRDRFIANAYCYAQDWNMHLIGDRNTGKIYKLSTDIYNDDSTSISTLIRTGHINHGSDMLIKPCLGLLIRIKRGVGLSSDHYKTAKLRIRWRDDGKPTWSAWKEIDLGAVGDTSFDIHVLKGRGGRYRSRQYEIEMGADAPLVLSGAWERIKDER